MKLKRKSKLTWGLYDSDGECVDTADTRRHAYALAKPNGHRVARVRVTVTPVAK